MGQKQLPEILSTEIVAKSRLFTVEALKLKFSNGAMRDYERMKGSDRGSVMIIAIDADRQMLLINEYCAGTHQYELSFPKGLIDPGETAEQAAHRELKEEAGFGAKRLVELKKISLAPGYFNAHMHIFLAFDLYAERLEGDEPEPLEVIHWPVDDHLQLLDNQNFCESRSVAGVLLAQQWLEQNTNDR